MCRSTSVRASNVFVQILGSLAIRAAQSINKSLAQYSIARGYLLHPPSRTYAYRGQGC